MVATQRLHPLMIPRCPYLHEGENISLGFFGSPRHGKNCFSSKCVTPTPHPAPVIHLALVPAALQASFTCDPDLAITDLTRQDFQSFIPAPSQPPPGACSSTNKQTPPSSHNRAIPLPSWQQESILPDMGLQGLLGFTPPRVYTA